MRASTLRLSLTVSLLALGVILTLTTVAQPPGRTSSFYGTVTVAGQDVPTGTVISALVGGVELDRSEVFASPEGSAYRLDLPADDPATAGSEGGTDGDTVEFRIAESPVATTSTFQGSLYQRVDLAAAAGADLAITKDDGVAGAAPGDTLTYTLTISNLDDGSGGGQAATGIVVEDPLPIGTSFVSASDGGSLVGDTVIWPAFDLAVGATVTRTLVVEVASTFPAGTVEIRNAATVRSDGSDGIDPAGGNNTGVDTNSLAGGPDLTVTKTADLTAIAPGQDVVYTLTITNTGFQDAAGVALADTLPAAVLFQTASDDGREVGGTVTWPDFDLALGATATRTVRVRLPETVGPEVSELLNTATATASVADVEPSDNTTTHTLPVTQQTDLSVATVDPSTATIDPQSLTIGGLVSVTVQNTGNANGTATFSTVVFEDLDGDALYTPGTDNLLGDVDFGGGVFVGTDALVEVPVVGTILFRNNLLYAFVDATDALPELDETNNVEHSARGCEAIPTPEDFAPEVEVSWPLGSTEERFSADVLATPIVVQLSDDNGDGRRDERDIPDIVFNSIDLTFPLNPTPRLRAIRGDTGETIWDAFPPVSQGFFFLLTGMAAGDIDGDGRPEIIAPIFDGPSGRPNALAAYEHNGNLKWVSSRYNTHPDGTTLTNRDNPLIVNLDGEGLPEIVVGATVFNANGSRRWVGTGGQGFQSARNADGFDSGAISIVADLDLEGDPEVVTGNTAYRSDGSIYWQIPFDDGYTAVANFDDDDFPEIVVVSRGVVRLHEHDGTLIWGPVDLPGDGAEAGGAPTVANFDDDPEPEIGVAGSTQYAVFESDGTIKWQSATQDGSSNMTGSTVFDLDGNGKFEVIYRDETRLRIYRGEDGFVLYELLLSSITFNEQPVVVDVDRDGNAEIVVSSDIADGVSVPDRTRGIRIIGDANDNWVAARPIWNQHQYNIDNINNDGSIPLKASPSWLSHNTYRANIAPVEGAFASPDLSASRLTVDLSAWPTITSMARVGNGGTTFAAGGVPVSFYDGDPAAGGQLLGTTFTSGDLDPGDFEDVSVSFPGAGFGTMDLYVVADDDGTGGGVPAGRQTECDETNNIHSRMYDTNDVGLLLTQTDGTAAVQPEEVYTYTLTVANASNFTRTGVTLTDTLPDFTTAVAVSDGGSAVGTAVTWPPFDLPAGATAVRTVTVQVDPAIPLAVTTLTNTATVDDDGSTGGDPTPDNNTTVDVNAVLTVRADAGGPYAGDEGIAIGFDASGSSDRDGTIVLYEWDLDLDGDFSDATGPTASRAFDDNGTFTISVRVTDDSGEQDTDTAEVVVGNLAPVVDAGPDQVVSEGSNADVAALFTDSGVADTHTATIDWGDGVVDPGGVTQGAGSGSVAGGHPYPDNGVFTVEVCVTDDDGDTGCDTLTVTVENEAPIALPEGDVDLATWNVENYGSSTADWQVAADGLTVNQRRNSDPSVFYGDFLATGVILEGGIRVATTGDDDFIGFVLGFQPGDRNNPNADFVLIDWKQGNQGNGRRGLAISRVRGIPSNDNFWAHTGGVTELARGLTRANTGWADNVEYTFRFQTSAANIRVWVNDTLEIDVDGDFNFGSGRFGFYNYSQSDVIYRSFTSLGRGLIEGGTVDISLPFNDVGIEDTHTATIDWQDGTVEPGTVTQGAGQGQVLGSHLYPDDGQLDVEICITDDDGGTGCGIIPVTVVNALPAVDAGADQLAYEGQGLDLTASFTDLGVLDTHTATIDWGDGTVEPGTVTQGSGSGTVAGQHDYAVPGIYTVEVCVTDDDAGTGCDSFEVNWLPSIVDARLDLTSPRLLVRPAEQAFFDLRITNDGTREPTNLVLTQTIPDHLSFVDATDGGVWDGVARTVTWTIPVLPFESSLLRSVTLLADPTLPFGTEVTTAATVVDDGSFGPDVTPENNSDSFVLTLWDEATPFVDPGDPVTVIEGDTLELVVGFDDSILPPVDKTNLLAFFEFEGDATDTTGNGHNGSVNGAVLVDDGFDGQAYFFDGSNDSISVPLNINPSVHPRLTMGAWVRASDTQVVSSFLSHDLGGFDRNLAIDTRGGGRGWSAFSGSGGVLGFEPVVLEEWTFVAVVYDQVARTVELYVNDKRFAEGGNLGSGWGSLLIGDSPGFNENFHGTIDNVFVFAEAFDECEVQALRFEQIRLAQRAAALAQRNTDKMVATHTATIDWRDGTIEPGTVVTTSCGLGVVTGSHVYPDDAQHDVEVCVTDAQGNSHCNTVDVTVLNADPNVNDNGDIDLRTWTTNHYDNVGTQGRARWDVAADGQSVLQVINSRPSIFYGDFFSFGTRITGKIRVETTGDDDFIGFALGYQPDDVTNPEANFLLLDWKQGNQGSASRGLALSRITGTTPDLWGHSTSASFEELARGLTLSNVGWRDNVEYEFTFEFGADRVKIWVDDVLQFDVEGEFEDGRLAFYNYSQSTVRYSAFQFDALVIDEGQTVNLEATFNDPGVLDTHTAEIDWMDGSTSPGNVTMVGLTGFVDASHLYLDNAPGGALYQTELCVTDDDGGVGCGIFPINVRNLPPVLDAGPDATGNAETPFLFDQALFSDPGILDTHTATVDWGDGSTSDGSAGDVTVNETGGAGNVLGSHTYAVAGTYTVSVCVTDKDGASVCDSFVVEIAEALIPPDLVLEKVDLLIEGAEGDGVANAGETIEYTLMVFNLGEGPATSVVLDDPTPALTTVVPGSVTTTQGTVVSESPLQVELGQVDPDTTATVTFAVTVGEALPTGLEAIVNQAVVSSEELEPVASDDPDTPEEGDPTVTPAAEVDDTTTCETIPFDDPEWMLANLGDADQGAFLVDGANGEYLQLTGDGTSLFHSGDNGAFYYREVAATADFRLEVDITGLPVDEGGQVRRTSLMVRTGLDPFDPRVMVTYAPHLPPPNPGDPDIPSLLFDARLEAGDGGVEIGNTEFNLPLPSRDAPIRLAIEKRGDVFTVLYSIDDGVTWTIPRDATFHGMAEIAVGETILAGMMVASYDPSVTFTAEHGDFTVCRPNGDPPFDPEDPPVCDPTKAIDAIVLLDVSGSMTASIPGAASKLEAAQTAIAQLASELASAPGSRMALVATMGYRTPAENLAGAYDLRAPLSTDLSSVVSLAAAIDPETIDPGTPTPSALSLRGLIDDLVPTLDPANQPVVVWFSDGIANIDILGRGPEPYELEELQAIELRDGSGAFLSWGQVGWSGAFNGETGTFDGEPLANAMFQLERLDAHAPDLLVYGLALEGDGVDLGTFNPGLLEYAAHVSGGRSFAASDLTGLLSSVAAVATDLDCGGFGSAVLTGRVWNDTDGDGSENPDTVVEPGLAGVTVNLFDGGGAGLTSAVTDGNGAYVFDGLPAGTYSVQVDASTLPTGAGGQPIDVATFDLDGIATVDTATLTVADGELRSDVSFGYQEQPPSELCSFDGFDGPGLDPAWQLVEIGDADQGSVAVVDGELHLTTDGTSLFHGTDNGTFLYQPRGGDFRSTLRVVRVPDDVGGPVRKVCLMAREGTGSSDARVMVCHIPHLPGASTQALQFDVRREDGTAEEIADLVINAVLPIRIGLVREGGTYRVEYSIDNGLSWIQPTGLLGGELGLDLGATPLLGVMGASYDANVTTTFAVDEFEVCAPNPAAP